MRKSQHDTEKEMLRLLEKPVGTQRLVNEYIQLYNQFIDDNPDMIENAETKAEMHKRVEDLCGKLLAISGQLQQFALEQREKVIASGALEFQLESLLVILQSLLQTETDRYRCFVKFAEDFYAAKNGLPLFEIEEDSLYAAIIDSDHLPPVEDPGAGSSPRLTALCQGALAALSRDTARGKKDPKPRPELKDAQFGQLVAIEKELLKWRVGMVREWGERRLKEIRGSYMLLYGRLQEWVRVRIKTGRDAIAKLALQLREAIEDERKLQDELRLKGMDVVRDTRFAYFLAPPPPPLSKLESRHEYEFTIGQLRLLLRDLRLLADADGTIELCLLVTFFLKRAVRFFC